MTIFIDLSWLVAGAAIVLAGATLVMLRRPQLALHVLLDLLLAAGLLRLSTDVTWGSIAVAAVLILLRRILTHALATAAWISAPMTSR